MSTSTEPDGPEQSPIREATVMRALAHPARLALLEHLGYGGPATATQCASVVDLSPSATSYHLRALARAGLVEAAPGRGDGREHLWRRTGPGQYELTDTGLDPDAHAARRELLESLLTWDEARSRRYLAQLDDEPIEWQQAAFFMDATLLLTAAELRELSNALHELLEPYRRSSRTRAPAGGRMASAIVRVLPTGVPGVPPS